MVSGVYFIRQYRENDYIYQDLFRILLNDHVYPRLSGAFRGFSAESARDLRQEVVLKLLEAIAAGDGSGDFTQVLFIRYLKLRIIDTWRHALMEAKGDRNTSIYDSLVENHRGEDLQIYAMIREALLKLPEPLRSLMIKRHVKSRQVGSDKWQQDSNFTLAREYKKSGKTIRAYLRKGEKKMRLQIRKLRGEV